MKEATIEKKRNPQEGHWILARLGKRVLRPGGMELTTKMIDNLDITPKDDVVEFAPGLGITAAMTCSKSPKSYTGVEINEEVAAIVKQKVSYDKMRIVVANAKQTTLDDECADKVYCEAMLTMQNDANKAAILNEAARILRPGGYFGLHEICLIPEDTPKNMKTAIYNDLSRTIKVNARPITVPEWRELLAGSGLELIKYDMNGMHLLEFKRVVADEGFFRTLKIMFNALTHPDLRKRVMGMRRIFRKYDDSMRAITIVAKKMNTEDMEPKAEKVEKAPKEKKDKKVKKKDGKE